MQKRERGIGVGAIFVDWCLIVWKKEQSKTSVKYCLEERGEKIRVFVAKRERNFFFFSLLRCEINL